MDSKTITPLLEVALTVRADHLDERHESAFRLFNGFYEGYHELVVDLYAATLVIHNYADILAEGLTLVETAQGFYLSELPWLQTVIVKTRNAKSQDERRGQIGYGKTPDHKVREHGIWYSLEDFTTIKMLGDKQVSIYPPVGRPTFGKDVKYQLP